MFVQFAVNVMGIGGQLRDEEETELAGMIALEDFSRKMGLPLRLSELGVDDSKFDEMAKLCTSYHADNMVGELEK